MINICFAGCQELTAKGAKGGWVRKRHFANKLKIFRCK